jgi:gliding motility-associated-like protein
MQRGDLLVYLLCFILFWMGGPGDVSAQCNCANCPVSLPDQLNVSFLGVIVVYNTQNDILGMNNLLEEVCIDIDHSFIGDLDITLISPDGTSVLLFADGNNDNSLGGSETCPCGNPENDMNVCFTLPGTTSNIFGTEGTGNCADQGYFDPCNFGGACYTGNWGTWNEGCEGGNGIAEFNNGTGTVSGTWFVAINDNAGVDQGAINDISLVFSNTVDSCFSLPPPPVLPPPPCSNQTTVSIPDNTGVPAFSTIANAGSTGTMGNGTELIQVCLLIDHTFIGDLDITLYEPDGSGVVLSSSNGGGSDDYGDVFSGTEVCFSPTATNSINGYSGGETGTWLPEGNLGDFNGDPNGDWNLLVLDHVGIDQGSILSWSIELTNGDCSADCTVRTSLSASFCTGSSYIFNGDILETGGIYTDTFALANGCDSVVELNLDEVALIRTDLIERLCAGDSISINGLDYFYSSGMYTDTLPTAFCDSVVILELSVEPIRFNTLNIALCPGDSVLLPGGFTQYSAGTYIDTIPGYFCDSVITTNITVNIRHDTTFYLSSCFPADTGTVVENLVNQFGCDSIVTTMTMLSRSDSIGYYTTTCDPTLTGTITDVLQNQFGCDSIITIITEIGPNTSSVISTTCDPMQAGITVDTFVSSNNCDSLVTTQTILLPSDVIEITSSTCDPNQAGYQSILLTNQYGCDSIINITSELLISHDVTIRKVTCTLADVGVSENALLNSYGCDSVITTITTLADTLTVEVRPTLSTIVAGESVELMVESFGSGEIFWSPSLFLSCDTCVLVSATPDYSINYIVERRIGDCIAYATSRIEVNQPQVFVPTAFSPNGDGHNDAFLLIPDNIAELLDLRVYNRWGELLFESDDLYEGWDGRFHGRDQEVDGYLYYLAVILSTGDRVTTSGLFFLIR